MRGTGGFSHSASAGRFLDQVHHSGNQAVSHQTGVDLETAFTDGLLDFRHLRRIDHRCSGQGSLGCLQLGRGFAQMNTGAGGRRGTRSRSGTGGMTAPSASNRCTLSRPTADRGGRYGTFACFFDFQCTLPAPNPTGPTPVFGIKPENFRKLTRI